MAMMGLCSDEVRLPLYRLSDKNRALVRETLESLNLLTAANG